MPSVFAASVKVIVPVGTLEPEEGWTVAVKVTACPTTEGLAEEDTATEVACLLATTSRIRLLPLSAMNRFPAPSTAIPLGLFSSADVAGPPSPLKPPPHKLHPVAPPPATVVITWVAASTRRIRLLP